ncbi:MAG TPA: BMP family ABC transporter substrate-binding protein [Thermotogota bacterium]|nr:BMP family ABC transporter substrate-binding protein [Thermotogota bacterium]HRW92272.1 BMP family ABC transporter substrate-binding protein [Thermotogota bacterium]
MKKILMFLVFLGGLSSLLLAFSVGIMITGEVGGNPIYEMMVSGAQQAHEKYAIEFKVVEAGVNAARWEPTLISLAATKLYDLVITFTEGMPSSVDRVASMFPDQKFALLDGIAPKRDNVFSLSFEDDQMAYLAGAFCGLVTLSSMEKANPQKIVGMIAGDSYPAMDNRIYPAFENGAKSIDPQIQVLFSTVGSWADPKRGQDLANTMFEKGADILFPVAGGSGLGVLDEALDEGKYMVGVDSNTISQATGTILGCALKRSDIAMEKVLELASQGKLPYGESWTWGAKEDVVGFTLDDPEFIRLVPENIRQHLQHVLDGLKDGSLDPLCPAS